MTKIPFKKHFETEKKVCANCGHKRPETIILDSNELSFSAWMQYWEQKGELCWDCFCKKFTPQSQEPKENSRNAYSPDTQTPPLKQKDSSRIPEGRTARETNSTLKDKIITIKNYGGSQSYILTGDIHSFLCELKRIMYYLETEKDTELAHKFIDSVSGFSDDDLKEAVKR